MISYVDLPRMHFKTALASSLLHFSIAANLLDAPTVLFEICQGDVGLPEDKITLWNNPRWSKIISNL